MVPARGFRETVYPVTSMVVGAALAIIVLAIFLKDIKPTLVVGISIPLSVLFAVVLICNGP